MSGTNKNKRGIFFTLDALLAMIIIIIVVLISYPVLMNLEPKTEIHEDMMNSFSALKIGELNNSYAHSLVEAGDILNKNKSVLEQIGEFYVTDRTKAELLAQSLLNDIPSEENIGIWFGTTLIASKNSTPYESSANVQTMRQLITGISEGQNITGVSARAYLSRGIQSEYFYFGGYVGEGNVTIRIDYNGTLNSSEAELTINNNFTLYINDIPSGVYSKSPSEIIPQKYTLPTANFKPGTNLIELRGQNLRLSGGYIKINYDVSPKYEPIQTYYFPGVKGWVNIYDAFFVPGTLNSLKITLHMNATQQTFLNIGNITVYHNATRGEETITLNNTYLQSKLNYASLSRSTIPLRLGMDNLSYITNMSGNADVFSVTDLSGSMTGCSGYNFFCCLFKSCQTVQSDCLSCSGTWDADKIIQAKAANKLFIDIMLNTSSNRVGLVGYKDNVVESNVHNLSSNVTSLKAKVDYWTAGGSTCICCGINRAKNSLMLSNSRFKSMIVMSDGEANVRCAEQGTATAKQDAINAACSAYNDYNITVNAVGFGSATDNATLQAIAACGHGKYYYSNITELANLYRTIAQDMIEAIYHQQTIEIIGNITSVLYPDSSIEMNYTLDSVPYGLRFYLERQFSSESGTNFSIPLNSTLIEAKLISYSGPKWTQKVIINNNQVYSIDNYGSDYTRIGDPYAINLPVNSLSHENNISVITALSQFNTSLGSISNKIIYSIAKNISSYSPIVSLASGCIWDIDFYDGTNTTLTIPSSYTGIDPCYFTNLRQDYNPNDAFQVAVFNLLKAMDSDGDYKVDSKFSEQSVEISSSEIKGIPFLWSTEAQIRTWR